MTTEIEEIQEEELDIDAQLAEAWQEITADEPEETAEEKADRLRDEQGRFAKKEEEQVEQVEEQPTESPYKAPSSWKKELQEKFNALPPEFQAEINRREEDFHKGISQYKNAAEWAQSFTPIAQEVNYLRQQYGNEVTGVGELAKLDRFANQDPVGFIQWFAKSRNIPLDGTGIPTEQDPTISALRQQVERLSGYVQQERLTKEQQEHQNALQQIDEFKRSMDAQDFETLKLDAAALLQAGQAKELKEAFEKAGWQHPAIRQKLISQQIAAEQEKARNKAIEAKKASAVNISKRGHLPSKQADDSLDDILSREAERLGFI